MSDLFDNAKSVKFLIAPKYLTDQELIILTDLEFWNLNFDKLQEWCKLNNSEQQGMTVVLPNRKTLTAFCLQWS